VRDYVVQGNNVAVVCECCWRHNTTGQIVHSPKLDLWKFKGGKAIEFFEFFDTDQAIGACVDCGPTLRKRPKPLYPENGSKSYAALSTAGRANVRSLRNFYKRYASAKGENYRQGIAMLAPHLTWMSLANGADGMPFTVKRSTPAEVEAYFTGLFAEWEMLEWNMDNYIAAGPYVVAHGAVKFRNRRTGKELSTPKADCCRYAHGKIVEFMEYYDTAGAIRAAA
jgi:ketosteroid isomerase-like protein